MPSALSPPGACNSSQWLPDSPDVTMLRCYPFSPHCGIITAGGGQEVCPHVFHYFDRPQVSSYLDFAMRREAGPGFVTSHFSLRNLGFHVAPRGMKSFHTCTHQNARKSCNFHKQRHNHGQYRCSVQGIDPKSPSEPATLTHGFCRTLHHRLDTDQA